jgi:hypothetical protein
MDAAQQIRDAFAEVDRLRALALADPALRSAVGEVKRLQSRRFAGSYADLMQSGPYAAAARFFLQELYSDRDFTQRDAQFARIAGAVDTLFPADPAEVAAALARLHALTERLDHAVARLWREVGSEGIDAETRYVIAVRRAGQRAEREMQLVDVLEVGRRMAALTRKRGLRTLLRMMRTPALAAGLGALQHFLEAGFDTFAAMGGTPQGAEGFLAVIGERESAFLGALFDAELVACVTELKRILGEAR